MIIEYATWNSGLSNQSSGYNRPKVSPNGDSWGQGAGQRGRCRLKNKTKPKQTPRTNNKMNHPLPKPSNSKRCLVLSIHIENIGTKATLKCGHTLPLLCIEYLHLQMQTKIPYSAWHDTKYLKSFRDSQLAEHWTNYT